MIRAFMENKGKLCEKKFFLNEALTHVRLYPINTIKPRKKTVNHPFKKYILCGMIVCIANVVLKR